MIYPTIPGNWTYVSDGGYPSQKEHGPYPRVLVAIAYHEHPEWGVGLKLAELRFLNGDKQRPYWVSVDKTLAPIENSAYGVVAWCPPVAMPVWPRPLS